MPQEYVWPFGLLHTTVIALTASSGSLTVNGQVTLAQKVWPQSYVAGTVMSLAPVIVGGVVSAVCRASPAPAKTRSELMQHATTTNVIPRRPARLMRARVPRRGHQRTPTDRGRRKPLTLVAAQPAITVRYRIVQFGNRVASSSRCARRIALRDGRGDPK